MRGIIKPCPTLSIRGHDTRRLALGATLDPAPVRSILNLMLIVRDRITPAQLQEMAKRTFGNLVKAVVDVERRIMAVNGELHSDEEALLLSDGSRQENLWGINIYPQAAPDELIEFDSLINIRPWQGNYTRNVDDPQTRQAIIQIVRDLLKG